MAFGAQDQGGLPLRRTLTLRRRGQGWHVLRDTGVTPEGGGGSGWLAACAENRGEGGGKGGVCRGLAAPQLVSGGGWGMGRWWQGVRESARGYRVIAYRRRVREPRVPVATPAGCVRNARGSLFFVLSAR